MHLGMLLDNNLDFQGHLKSKLNKVNKTIGLLRKLHNTFLRLFLLTIYESFIRPHHIWSCIRFISPKIRVYQIQLSSSYNGRHKRDIYRETWARFGIPCKKKMIQGNYAASIKFIKVILQNTFLTSFPLLWVDITQGILITFLNSK